MIPNNVTNWVNSKCFLTLLKKISSDLWLMVQILIKMLSWDCSRKIGFCRIVNFISMRKVVRVTESFILLAQMNNFYWIFESLCFETGTHLCLCTYGFCLTLKCRSSGDKKMNISYFTFYSTLNFNQKKKSNQIFFSSRDTFFFLRPNCRMSMQFVRTILRSISIFFHNVGQAHIFVAFPINSFIWPCLRFLSVWNGH